MNKKVFLLEVDENLNKQLISYLKNFFDINLENFDSAENLFKASVSQQPEVIILALILIQEGFFLNLLLLRIGLVPN